MSTQEKVALIIGIDKYQNQNLATLDSCKKDAQDMFETLSNLGYKMYENSALIGSNLDKENGWSKVRETIVEFFDAATPAQTLLFYYSGHGIAWADDVFLGTPQIDPSKPMARGFSFQELTKLMSNCRSKRVVGIIDACHAGAINLPDSVLKDSPEAHATLALAKYDQICKNVPEAEGINLLLSSQAYEPSAAMKGSNSLYTKYLLEGLKGIKPAKDSQGMMIPGSVEDNGNITPASLHKYVYYQVASRTRQLPKIKADQSSEIVIATVQNFIQMPSAIRVKAKVIVGTRPRHVAIIPKMNEVYVSNSGSNNVTVIDTKTYTVKTIPVGTEPVALIVSHDESQVYVGNNGGDVSVIDTATKQPLRPIVTDGPVRDLAITPDGRKIYLAMEWSGLKKIDTSTNIISIVKSVTSTPVQEVRNGVPIIYKKTSGLPEGVAVTADGNYLYVSYQGSGPIGIPDRDSVAIFNAVTEEEILNIGGFPNVGGPIAISPDGLQAWVNGLDACSAVHYEKKDCPFNPGGVINIIDIPKNKHLKTLGIHIEDGTDLISFFPNSSLAIVGGNNLKMIDTKDFSCFGKIPIATSGSIVFTPDSRYAYVPIPNQDMIMVLEISYQTSMTGKKPVFEFFEE